MKHIIAWNDVGIACHLTLIGEGSAVSEIKKRSAKNPDLFTFKDRMSHHEVLEELKDHHIGILPMPATKVWKLASPLKRGEYLASGLLVVGLDHQGHRFDDEVGSWMQLHDASILRTKISSFLNSMSDKEFSRLSQSAIEYANEHLSWSKALKSSQTESEVRTMASVCLVVTNGCAPDPRVERHARWLAESGHEVTIFAWDRNHTLDEKTDRNGYTILRKHTGSKASSSAHIVRQKRNFSNHCMVSLIFSFTMIRIQ